MHNKNHSIDADVVRRASLQHAIPILQRLLPNGRLIGHEYKATNPRRHDNSIGSFSINVYTGKWADFATGDKGGDLISLVA